MNILVIDIGNTKTSVGVINTDRAECVAKDSFPSIKVEARLGLSVSMLVKQFPELTAIPATVCSVNSERRKEALEVLEKAKYTAVEWVRHDKRLPITSAYKDPAKLGPDRLVDLLYCYRTFPGVNAIVVDAGTAITIDVLEKGAHFAGGAIMPGVEAQLQAMHQSTVALPPVPVGSDNAALPGTTTEECMRAGVMYGVAGAIHRIVEECRKRLAGEVVVVATGGAWPHIQPFMDIEVRHVPDLTLIGISVYRGLFVKQGDVTCR